MAGSQEIRKKPYGSLCGAKRRDGETCTNYAMPNGRCRMHGGKTGAKLKKVSNKEKKTGDIKTPTSVSLLFDSVLSPKEKLIWAGIPVNIIEIIDDHIRLLSIRELRMMERIESLKQNPAFTVVKKSRKRGTSVYGEPIDEREQVAEGTLGQIQKIENDLSIVQDKKTRAIELKMKILQIEKADPDDDALDDLALIIKRSAKLVRDKKEAEAKEGRAQYLEEIEARKKK